LIRSFGSGEERTIATSRTRSSPRQGTRANSHCASLFLDLAVPQEAAGQKQAIGGEDK
jgi:hypothetical protein